MTICGPMGLIPRSGRLCVATTQDGGSLCLSWDAAVVVTWGLFPPKP